MGNISRLLDLSPSRGAGACRLGAGSKMIRNLLGVIDTASFRKL